MMDALQQLIETELRLRRLNADWFDLLEFLPSWLREERKHHLHEYPLSQVEAVALKGAFGARTASGIVCFDDFYAATSNRIVVLAHDYNFNTDIAVRMWDGGRFEAEELAQEIVRKIIEKDVQPNEQAAYVRQAVRNAIIDQRRRSEVQSKALHEIALTCPSHAAHSPLEQAIRNESAEIVRQAVAKLPERVRAVATLLYLEGWKRSQVATAIGTSQAAVNSLANRARQALSQELILHGF